MNKPAPTDAVMMTCVPPIENQHQLFGTIAGIDGNRAVLNFGPRITMVVDVSDLTFEPRKPWLKRDRWLTRSSLAVVLPRS